MAYQISKLIASYGATLRGRVDAVILTGGCAHEEYLVNLIKDRVSYLGPVFVIPGEREMYSLAYHVNKCLRKEISCLSYD